jgi:DNA-binding SARP family transcriptional activator
VAEAALALYRGPFLALERYSEWASTARQHYQRLWTTLLKRMAYTDLAERRMDHAILQLIDATPDDEDAVHLSMVAHAVTGRRGEALRIYHALREHLAQALGSQPKPELRALSEDICSGASIDDLLTRLT